MKRLAIHHTAMPPEGEWSPKPATSHFRFLDWVISYYAWQDYLKKTIYAYRNEPKTN